MNNPSEGNSSTSSSKEPAKDDISNTHSQRDEPQTDLGKSTETQPQQPSPLLYYTRSAARRLPPPSPEQLRAGKLLIKNIDRHPRSPRRLTVAKQTTTSNIKPTVPPAQPPPSRIVPLGPPPSPEQLQAGKLLIKNIDKRPHRPRPLTVVKQTTTSRTKPPVPPAQPSPSGIVPLGPPPPREPLRPYSPPPAEPVVGRFDHLPPPSVSFDVAWKLAKDFVDGIEKMKDELGESKLKDLMLALQVDLGLPPEVSLIDMLESRGEIEDVMEFVWDYFQTSEVPPAETMSETKP